MKPRDYCCCAIPVVNAGIYLTLIEQMVLGITVGVLAMAAPDVVGSAVAMVGPMVFGILCVITGALQLLGFIGVAGERPILFRRFLSLHSLLTLACFATAAVLIILSATRHNTAKADCTSAFFDVSDSTQRAEANALCEIFPWVDVGVMGAAWVLVGVVHIYLWTVMSAYSTGQEMDHDKYNSLTGSDPNKF